MADIHPTPVRHAMVNALAPDLSIERAFSLIRGAQRPNVSAVCSVQRMRLPDGRDAQWAALEYAQWLAQALHPLIRVNVDAQRNIRFVARLWSVCLLELRYAPERSTGIGSSTSSVQDCFQVPATMDAWSSAKCSEGGRSSLRFTTTFRVSRGSSTCLHKRRSIDGSWRPSAAIWLTTTLCEEDVLGPNERGMTIQ